MVTTVVPAAERFKCTYTYQDEDGDTQRHTERIQWRQFAPRCPKLNMTCNSLGVAWVAVTTVCQQRLF